MPVLPRVPITTSSASCSSAVAMIASATPCSASTATDGASKSGGDRALRPVGGHLL